MLLSLALALAVAAPHPQNTLQRRALTAPSDAHFELTAFGGVPLLKDLYRAGGAGMGLDGGKLFGGRLAYHPGPKLGIELSYTRQKGDLKERSGTTGFASPAPFGELTVQQADVAALLSQAVDPQAKSRGFMVVGAGATRFEGDQAVSAGSSKATRFAWLVGLGTKLRLGAKTSLRLEGRYRNTRTNGDGDVYADANGNPYRYAKGWYRTGEVTAGITLRP